MKWMDHMALMGEIRNEMDGPHGTNGREKKLNGWAKWHKWERREIKWMGHMAQMGEKRNEIT
jgi:hypothetical protein